VRDKEELEEQFEREAASEERTGQSWDLQVGCEESGQYSIDGRGR